MKAGPGDDLAARGETVILKDGGSIGVRALGPTDHVEVSAFFDGLSPSSRRLRFCGSRKRFLDSEIDAMTRRDPAERFALAAVERRGGAERIAGIAEFARLPETTRAEFAVAIADDHQGRGLGTVLLERIAAAARRAGVLELEALVLRDNSGMLDVFAQSGFALTQTADGDTMRVSFPIAETAAFLAASFERERIAARESIRVFFEPQSIAIVGASRREGTIGRAIVSNLVAAGFRGPIYPINPNAKEILGLPCFPSLTSIGRPVDLIVVAAPASEVSRIVGDAAAVHARGVVVISSGFAEVSAEGRIAEEKLRTQVRDLGMRLVGPNCMGVLNATPSISMNATFAPAWPPSGNVSMMSQSGALGIAMLDYARQLNVGLAGFVSVGNKADVSSNDLLAYWADDPNTKVIVLYLESFGNARKFARLAPSIARKKPIVAVKSGRSAAGTRAAASHSAALASLDVGIDAVFEQAGVIRTNTLEELFDVVSLLSTEPAPNGPRVGVVTNAGGPGILLADACEAHGLSLPSLSPSTLDALRTFLPAQAGLANPIDMIASATAEQYERTIELVGNDPLVDSVVVIYIPPFVTEPEQIARAIANGAGRIPKDKPIATVFMSSKGTPAVLADGPRGKIPSYAFPENVALALAAALRHARFRARDIGKAWSASREQERAIRDVVEREIGKAGAPKFWLSSDAVFSVLELLGVAVAASTTTVAEPDAVADAATGIGFPVVLKAVAKNLVHKSDAGGVVLDLDSREAVRSAAVEMTRKVGGAGYPLEGFFIQRQIAGGHEFLVGVTTDPSLGPIVVAGLGGVQVELIGDAAFRLPPVTDLDARDMLDSLKARKLFEGFRGAQPADRDAFSEVICKISTLVEIVPEITELDLNPLKVMARGGGAVVVDGRIRIAYER